jgi:hypothetical protein
VENLLNAPLAADMPVDGAEQEAEQRGRKHPEHGTNKGSLQGLGLESDTLRQDSANAT